MNLTRLLADPPDVYDVSQIAAPGMVACNLVGGQIAGYWPTGSEPTQQEWETIVVAHVPVAEPDPVAQVLAELPAATLEETNDIIAQVLALIGGNP